MKQGWEIKKLGEVCEITMGQSPSSNTYNDSEGLPFYQGNGDFGKVNPIARVYCNAPIRIAECNDILISVRAPIGAINIANCKCCIGRGLASIRSTKSLSYEFVYHALIANKEKLIAQGTGSTFKSIGRSILKELPIPVPPLPIQERIVSELDLLNGIIEKKREQLKELDALAQSIFYDMFGDPITNEKGWEVKKLGEEFNISSGGTPDTKITHYWDGGNISWIGSNMCQNEIIYNNDGKYITDLGLSNSSAKVYQEGYVLVALVGATIGKTALLRFPTATNQNVAGINVPQNSEYTSEFIFCLIRNLYELFVSIGSGKFKMANLSFIRSLPLLSPPLPLQHQFASKIEAIERQKELIKQSISETETLFNARMQHYFN